VPRYHFRLYAATDPDRYEYWASGLGRLFVLLQQLLEDVLGEIERHVRAWYLAGMQDGSPICPMVIRCVRGIVPG
jgi:hypothetical protein